jgi:transposase InsO family protein
MERFEDIDRAERQGGERKLPRLFGEQEQSAGEVESREGGSDLGAAEIGTDRAGLEEQQGHQFEQESSEAPDSPRHLVSGRGRSRSNDRLRRRVRASEAGKRHLSGSQRLLILDSWLRSKLPANDFASIAGVAPHTLYQWRKRFEEEGPAGLAQPQGRRSGGSRLSEPTRRAILMLKDAHPEWGEDRIHDVLVRTEGFAASPGAIGRVLSEAGWEVRSQATRPHEPPARRFERTRPNELWQTDLFTFVLKRENRRVHLVAYLDDYSRFIVGFGLYASASGALVREVFEASIANFGAPEEVLTDNGTQYHTWRGKSAFTELCERRGIKQIVAAPRHPQTLGKIERFWGSLWRELLEGAIFRGLDDARVRIGYFLDHYNFSRPHQGLGGLVPADRYFQASAEVRLTLAARVRANSLELAQHGEPRKPFYLTGRVGGKSIALFAEGERVILTNEDGEREEVDLSAPGRRARPEEIESDSPLTPQAAPPDHPAVRAGDGELAPPASSPLDGILERLARGLEDGDDEDGGAALAVGGAS